MTGTLTLTEDDYLIHALFNASKSKKIRKGRTRWILIRVGICAVLTMIFYEDNNSYLTFCFFIALLYNSTVYPIYQKRNLKKDFIDQIAENYQGMIGKTYNIDINDDYISSYDDSSEEKTKTSEVIQIDEIEKYFFIKYRIGAMLILPKRMFEYDILCSELNEIADKNKIHVYRDLHWKW